MLKFILLIILVSCGTRPVSRLSQFSNDQKLGMVTIVGEGKGRLSVDQHQYLFSVDALLKQTNWLFVVTIPLHGEEILEFKNLKSKKITGRGHDSFETRVYHALNDIYPGKKYDRIFVAELRQFLRLILAKELGLERSCSNDACFVEDSPFLAETIKDSFILTRTNSANFTMSLSADQLNDSRFEKVTYKVLDPSGKEVVKLEFFWNT